MRSCAMSTHRARRCSSVPRALASAVKLAWIVYVYKVKAGAQERRALVEDGAKCCRGKTVTLAFHLHEDVVQRAISAEHEGDADKAFMPMTAASACLCS